MLIKINRNEESVQLILKVTLNLIYIFIIGREDDVARWKAAIELTFILIFSFKEHANFNDFQC